MASSASREDDASVHFLAEEKTSDGELRAVGSVRVQVPEFKVSFFFRSWSLRGRERGGGLEAHQSLLFLSYWL